MTASREDSPGVWWSVRLTTSAVLAVLVEVFDRPVFGVDLLWWVCVLIGLVVGFGGWLIIVIADDDT